MQPRLVRRARATSQGAALFLSGTPETSRFGAVSPHTMEITGSREDGRYGGSKAAQQSAALPRRGKPAGCWGPTRLLDLSARCGAQHRRFDALSQVAACAPHGGPTRFSANSPSSSKAHCPPNPKGSGPCSPGCRHKASHSCRCSSVVPKSVTRAKCRLGIRPGSRTLLGAYGGAGSIAARYPFERGPHGRRFVGMVVDDFPHAIGAVQHIRTRECFASECRGSREDAGGVRDIAVDVGF